MNDYEKRELRFYAKKGYAFTKIRKLVYCSSDTIRKYIKIFSPATPKGGER